MTFFGCADSSIKYFCVMSSNNHEWMEKNFKCQEYISTSIHVHVYINIDEKMGHDKIIDLINVRKSIIHYFNCALIQNANIEFSWLSLRVNYNAMYYITIRPVR